MNLSYYTEVLKKYAVFTGRSRRAEYWTFALVNIAIYIVAYILGEAAGFQIGSLIQGIVFIYWLAVLIPSLAVGVRRLHDIGRTGWWLLIGLIPVLGPVVLLIFGVMDSQPGDNQYGPNPKGVAGDAPQAPGAPINTPPTPSQPQAPSGAPATPQSNPPQQQDY